MKQSREYMVVYNSSGIGIYTNQEKLLRDKLYIGKAECKNFNDYESAVEYVVGQYNSKYAASSENSTTCYLDTLRLNWWYFSKNF